MSAEAVARVVGLIDILEEAATGGSEDWRASPRAAAAGIRQAMVLIAYNGGITEEEGAAWLRHWLTSDPEWPVG